jgi:hypothetical protein
MCDKKLLVWRQVRLSFLRFPAIPAEAQKYRVLTHTTKSVLKRESFFRYLLSKISEYLRCSKGS